MGQDSPHQAQGLDTDLQGTVRRQGVGESAVGIDEGVRNVEFLLFSCQVGMDAGTNRLYVDDRTREAIFFEDIDIGLDLDIVGRVFPTWILSDVVYEVSQVNGIRECRLPRHGEQSLKESLESTSTLRRCGRFI